MRSPRPLDLMRSAVALAVLVERHAGRPCPTADDIASYTGIPFNRAWSYVGAFVENGLFELEERGPRVQRQRRLRVFCGEWTDWTRRKPRSVLPRQRRRRTEVAQAQPKQPDYTT